MEKPPPEATPPRGFFAYRAADLTPHTPVVSLGWASLREPSIDLISREAS